MELLQQHAVSVTHLHAVAAEHRDDIRAGWLHCGASVLEQNRRTGTCGEHEGAARQVVTCVGAVVLAWALDVSVCVYVPAS